MLKTKHTPLVQFLGVVILIGAIALFGPADQTLGAPMFALYIYTATGC